MKHSNGMNLSLGVLNSNPKQGFTLSFPIEEVTQAIGFVASHHINFMFVYEEEAQNLKEGKWYPYKVFIATPSGWLKVDGTTLTHLPETDYGLAAVETRYVLEMWKGNMGKIKQLLGL